MKLELPDSHINDLQRASIKRLIETVKSAHFTDIVVRIGGQDKTFEADWLKHLRFTDEPKTPATVDELERLLNSEDDRPITINPDGSISEGCGGSISGGFITGEGIKPT